MADTLIGKVSALATRVGEELRELEAAGHLQGTAVLEEDVASGGAVALPGGLAYVPGRGALQVCWNGLACALGDAYEEAAAGDAGTASSIVILFDAVEGDEFQFFVHER